MRANLWSDIDAVERLARGRHATEQYPDGSCGKEIVLPAYSSPYFPDHPEFDIGAVGSSAKMAGGDFYDFFFVSDDTLAVTVADVAGKGVPAALLMEVTRSMVRNLMPACHSPGETLTRVNRILYDAELGSMYVTIFLGWYSTRTGVMRYANAGHPLPYRLDRAGDVRPFGCATGPILGILDVGAYTDEERRLAVGEKLVLYTDGVTEAADRSGELLGAERFEALLAKHAGEPVDRLCESVHLALDSFQAGLRQDDATLVCLQRNQ